MSAYEVHRIDDLEKIPVTGADINWRPIRRPLGIRAFGINAYTATRESTSSKSTAKRSSSTRRSTSC
jgi:hypothetical protein